MVYLSGVDLPNKFDKLFVDNRIVMLMDSSDKVLTKGKDRSTTQIRELYLFGHIFTNFKVRLNLSRCCQFDFFVFIFHLSIFDNDTIAPDFQISFVRVDNDVKIVIGAKLSLERIAKHLFQNGHEGHTVDQLIIFKLRKRFD